MSLIWIAIFMSLIQTTIFWMFSRHFQNREKKELVWLVFFAFFTIFTVTKWTLAEWKILSGILFWVFMLAWCGLTKKMTGERAVPVVTAVILSCIDALSGDFLAIVILYRGGAAGVQEAEQIGSAGYLRGMLLSYCVQLCLSFLYAFVKEYRKGDVRHRSRTAEPDFGRKPDCSREPDGTGKSDYGENYDELLVFMLIGQFIFLLFALVLLNLQRTYVSVMWLPYILLQCTFAAIIFWVILKHIKNEELEDMKHQLEIMETWNRHIYYHYRELERSYQRLHGLRHDFQNLLNTVYLMQKNGDNQNAEKILKEMEQMIAGKCGDENLGKQKEKSDF